MSRPFLTVSQLQSDCMIQAVDTNSHTEWQTRQIQIIWLLRSQLIWIYTVCKGRACLGSAGRRLSTCVAIIKQCPVLWQSTGISEFSIPFGLLDSSIICENIAPLGAMMATEGFLFSFIHSSWIDSIKPNLLFSVFLFELLFWKDFYIKIFWYIYLL